MPVGAALVPSLSLQGSFACSASPTYWGPLLDPQVAPSMDILGYGRTLWLRS